VTRMVKLYCELFFDIMIFVFLTAYSLFSLFSYYFSVVMTTMTMMKVPRSSRNVQTPRLKQCWMMMTMMNK
jgi:hypothetical protein